MKKFIVSILVAALLIGMYITVGHAEESCVVDSATDEDASTVIEQINDMEDEIIVLAKVLYSEAKGVKSKTQQAAVVWCVLNRVDAGYNNGTIIGVATARHQFAYKKKLKARYYEPFTVLVRDVLQRWLLEKMGYAEVGRVLPSDYFWFSGNGKINKFRNVYKFPRRVKKSYWDWSLISPYEN